MPAFPAPELLSRHTAVPGRVSVGDTAAIRLHPGLLKWLMTSPADDIPPPGRGIHPMSGIPLGIAVEAAIIAASGKELGNDVLKSCTSDHLLPVYGSEELRAEGTVTTVGRRHVEVETVVSRCSDDAPVYRGTMILVHVKGGRAVEISGAPE